MRSRRQAVATTHPSSCRNSLRARPATERRPSPCRTSSRGMSHCFNAGSLVDHAARASIVLFKTIQSSHLSMFAMSSCLARPCCDGSIWSHSIWNRVARVHCVEAWCMAETSSSKGLIKGRSQPGCSRATRFIALETRSRTTSSPLK